MDTPQQKSPALFLTHVNNLLSSMESWAMAEGLKVSKSEVELNEEVYGRYLAPKITILHPDGSMLAEITPIGASVLGANGRVDMQGYADKVILLDLDAGGPVRHPKHLAGSPEPQTRPLFRGIGSAGWYWIENRVSSKGHKLGREVFFDLLAEVADYECHQ